MKHWTRTRWISFIVHVAFVSVPFLASSISALLLWQSLFNSWWYAVPLVLIIDVLALAGLVLYIARIPSPFVPLRHVLPFVSVVPLGRELYLLLAHNGPWLALTVTVLVTVISTAIAWQCFGTIERLFVSPVQAARERAREQLSVLAIELAQLTEKNEVVQEFVSAWQRQDGATDTPLSEVVTTERPALTDNDGLTAKIKAYAARAGVSVRTAWRHYDSGKVTADQLVEVEA